MTPEEAVSKMRTLAEDDDWESAHISADEVLCDLLTTLGFGNVVDEYHEVGKWYA